MLQTLWKQKLGVVQDDLPQTTTKLGVLLWQEADTKLLIKNLLEAHGPMVLMGSEWKDPTFGVC